MMTKPEFKKLLLSLPFSPLRGLCEHCTMKETLDIYWRLYETKVEAK